MRLQIVKKIPDCIPVKSRDVKYFLSPFIFFVIASVSLGVLAEGALSNASQEEINPFLPKLPQEEKVVVEEEPEPEFLKVAVQGVIWDTDTPQAIIDGEVYKLGEALKGEQGEIVDIDKEGVTIKYRNKKYKLKIKKPLKKEKK